ncbi:MAG TPA: restriction endonuclease subunit S [Thermoanaerobaculia bacterium]
MTSAVSDWEIGRRAGELPEGWAETTLEEIVVHKLGGEWGEDPRKAAERPDLVRVRVIRGTDFRHWERDRGTTAEERLIKPASLARRQLAVGDLVVEVSGGGASQPVGRTLLIDEEAIRRAGGVPLICSNFCRQVRVHREIDPSFVHLALSYTYLCGGFDEHQTQTTNLRNLDFKGFLSTVLPLPPRAEQRRIVDKVAELMAPLRRVREGLARVPETLRRFRQSVLADAYMGRLTEDWRDRRGVYEPLAPRLARAFAARREAYESERAEAEAFDRRAPRKPKNLAPTEWEAPEPLEVPEVPEGWGLVALQDLIHRAQYGLSVKADGNPRTGVVMLRMANIKDGRMDDSDLKYVDRVGIDVRSFTVQPGDILFNRTNSAELVGKAAVFDLKRESVFASYLVRVRCDEHLVDSHYLCGWMSSPWGRRWARTVRTDCSNQSNINVSRLQRMPVPVPPLVEQREIVRRIDELLAFAAAIEKRVAMAEERTEQVRRIALAKALRGELVPTEAELARKNGDGGEGGGFEPASELLGRVGAERLTAAGGVAGMAMSPEVHERILAAIRQACWGAGEMTREELIRKVAVRLGSPRFGKSVRARLEMHVEVAVARRIVARQGDLLTGATPTFGRYDYVFLMETVRQLAGRGAEFDKDEIVRAVAAWLGYGQVTPAIRERMDRVFRWAAQDGTLEIREGRIVAL